MILYYHLFSEEVFAVRSVPDSPVPAPEGSFASGVRAAAPVVLGYLAIGFAFGVVARTAGMSVAEIAIMSVLLYAGSAQFIGAGMLAAGDPASAIISTTFLVNLRHLLLSAALAPSFRGLSVWQNLLAGAELTDETFAVAATHLSGGRPAHPAWIFGLNLTAHVTWLAATVAGGLFGQAIPDTGALGLDFALPAMFVALLMLQATNRKQVAVAVVAAALAVGVGVLVPGRWNVIVATVLAAGVGVWLDQWK